MPDWDEDSPQLRDNLARVLRGIRDDARLRLPPAVEAARRWQAGTMEGLRVPRPQFAGRFRGEAGLEKIEVAIRGLYGVAPQKVAAALAQFEEILQRAVLRLDQLIAPDAELDADRLSAVIDLCAFAHAEWVRIHPFANGNGRTARLWANSLAMRYGLPPFIRLRPRPDLGYGHAAVHAMLGRWQPTAAAFRLMLNEFLGLSARQS